MLSINLSTPFGHYFRSTVRFPFFLWCLASYCCQRPSQYCWWRSCWYYDGWWYYDSIKLYCNRSSTWGSYIKRFTNWTHLFRRHCWPYDIYPLDFHHLPPLLVGSAHSFVLALFNEKPIPGYKRWQPSLPKVTLPPPSILCPKSPAWINSSKRMVSRRSTTLLRKDCIYKSLPDIIPLCLQSTVHTYWSCEQSRAHSNFRQCCSYQLYICQTMTSILRAELILSCTNYLISVFILLWNCIRTCRTWTICTPLMAIYQAIFIHHQCNQTLASNIPGFSTGPKLRSINRYNSRA